MTCRALEMHRWNAVQQRDRLLGCSLTGWQDMVNATGMSRDQQIRLLESLRKTAHRPPGQSRPDWAAMSRCW